MTTHSSCGGAMRAVFARVAMLCGLTLSVGCTPPQSEPDPVSDVWISLFDGSGLDHWRGYRSPDVPAAWRAEDGLLAFVPGADGGDIVSREQYGDFELTLEWRISEGGNSGILYRASEHRDNVWETAPEMQVLDNARHVDGRSPLTSAGANYALHAPAEDVTRPVGDWNEVRILARGAHVEHWLNGRKLLEYEQGSPEWRELVRLSKFATMPDYGRYLRGHIVLQDHGDRVWYRNIRIRRLDRPVTALDRPGQTGAPARPAPGP